MNGPLVSVLLCTGREEGVWRKAVECYLSQDYENKELVFMEGGEFKNLAQKRNEGVRRAKGKYVVHFDDDDWSGPGRVRDQVGWLEKVPEVLIHGYGSVYWWDGERASRYFGLCWGANLCYRRSYALEHPWDEKLDLAEDVAFLMPALTSGRVMCTDAKGNFVAVQRSDSIKRPIGGENWKYVDSLELPEAFRCSLTSRIS